MKLKIIFFVCVISFAGTTSAQQKYMPGRILFRIKPEAILPFRLAFANPEIHDRKFDPQKFKLKDQSAIAALLGPAFQLKVFSIKPLIPQHNIVLEELRERTNPTLFPKTNRNGIVPKETEDLAKLRSIEEKVSRWFELFFDSSMNVDQAISYLKKSGMIEFAEPRYRNSLCFTPNDPLFGEQYSLPLIHAPQAWDVVKCDSTMLVADDDIGADWTHEDLAKAVYINTGETGLDADSMDKRSNGIDDDGDGFVDDWHGWDFAGSDGTAPDNDPTTTAVHGTHTSGIMAATGNNNIGICGVAFGSKVLILKCSDDYGSDVAFGYEGIVYAADRGAKVVNNSWGGTNREQLGEDIINYANAKNCVVVASAGNEGASVEDLYHVFEYLYPAAYNHVLSVAAVDQGGNITDFSEYNSRVDVSSPGLNVLSTVPGNQYSNQLSGTSQAGPNAAGAIALIRQKFPDLTTDQAIQRLRATSDPLTVAQDRHPGYTGRGRVNAYRAVTENPVFSARLDSVEIFDSNHDGAFESGEMGDIILDVRNYLSPLTNLIAKIDFLNDTGNFIASNTNVIVFGKANTMSLVQNNLGDFHITVSPSTPTNYSVLVRLTYSSAIDGYGPDLDYFTLVINKGYLDLNKNNLTVTFDSKANIGYDDPPNNTEGSGFLWRNAPSSIKAEGKEVLFQGGLMVGSDANHIVAAAPSAGDDNIAEQDFSPLTPIHEVNTPDHANAFQELQTTLTDQNAQQGIQPRVVVNQRMYAFGQENYVANAVVVDYIITKRDDSAASAKTAAALFMDWDIGSSGAVNQAYISVLDTQIGVTRRLEDSYPFIGMKIISDIPTGASINIYTLDNNGLNGGASTYHGFSQSDKWLTMTTPRPLSGIGDVSMIYGLKNINLAALDSVHLTYILAMAENEQLLKQTIDQTQRQWFNTSTVRPDIQPESILQVSPNPFSDHLHIKWNSTSTEEKAEVTITDIIGRILLDRTIQSNQLDLKGFNLPAGSYTLIIRQGNIIYRSQIIREP